MLIAANWWLLPGTTRPRAGNVTCRPMAVVMLGSVGYTALHAAETTANSVTRTGRSDMAAICLRGGFRRERTRGPTVIGIGNRPAGFSVSVAVRGLVVSLTGRERERTSRRQPAAGNGRGAERASQARAPAVRSQGSVITVSTIAEMSLSTIPSPSRSTRITHQ